MRDLVIDVYMSPSVLYFMCGKLSHLPARSGTQDCTIRSPRTDVLLGPHIKQGQRLHFHCTEILPAKNRSLVHVNPASSNSVWEDEKLQQPELLSYTPVGLQKHVGTQAVSFTALRATTCWQMRELATQESYDKKQRRRAEPSVQNAIYKQEIGQSEYAKTFYQRFRRYE